MSTTDFNQGLELLDACYDDIAYARYLIKKNGGKMCSFVNYCDEEFGNSILHFMVYNDLSDAVEMLLMNGADPNIRNFNNETPLHWSTRMGSLKSTSLLIDYGIDTNARDNSGGTALHNGASVGNPECIPLLLSSGIGVDITDSDHMTAFDIAKIGQGEGFSAVAFILQKHLMRSESSRDLYIPKPGMSVKNSRRGYDLPGVETQVDHTMLMQSASATGIVTRLDVVSNANSRNGGGLDQHQNDHFLQIATSGTQMTSNSSGPTPGRGLTRAASVSSEVVQSLRSPAEGGFFGSPNKRRASVLAFWSSASRSGAFDPPVNVDDLPNPNVVVPRSLPIHYEQSFPPALFAPFIPSSSPKYDVMVIVEQCADCDKHSMSLWHDAGKYATAGDALLRESVMAIYKQAYPIRVIAAKVKPVRSRVGALELTIAIKCAPKKGTVDKLRVAVGTDAASSASGGGGNFHEGLSTDPNHKGWFTYTAHSKLTTRCWPAIDQSVSSAVQFLDAAMCNAGQAVIKTPKAHAQNSQKLYGELQTWSKRLFGKDIPISPPLTSSTDTVGHFDQSIEILSVPSTSMGQKSKNKNGGPKQPGLNNPASFIDMNAFEHEKASYEQKAMVHFLAFDATARTN